MARTARISPTSEIIIQEMVTRTGKSQIEVIEEALKLYRFRERMHEFNEAYADLQRDEKAWAGELAEREEWEGTLMDGLSDE